MSTRNRTKRVDPQANYRFSVEIEGIGEASFRECTLPSLEVAVDVLEEGGFNDGVHHLVSRLKPGRIQLKRGVTHSNELAKWFLQVLQGHLAKAERNISVIHLDAQQNELLRLNFERAFPVKWSGSPLNSAADASAVESIEIAYMNVSL